MMSRIGFYIIFVTSLLINRNMGFHDRLFGREKKTDQVTLTLPTESFAVVRADDAEKGKALMEDAECASLSGYIYIADEDTMYSARGKSKPKKILEND